MMSNQRLQPFTEQEFKEIYSKVPRLTVEVIMKTTAGVLLELRQEKSWQGLWHIPGGTVHYGEKIKDAVQRIAQEEASTSVHIKKLIGYIEYPSEQEQRGFGWSIGLTFLCEPTRQISQTVMDEQNLQFFTELPNELVEEQREILNQVLLDQV